MPLVACFNQSARPSEATILAFCQCAKPREARLDFVFACKQNCEAFRDLEVCKTLEGLQWSCPSHQETGAKQDPMYPALGVFVLHSARLWPLSGCYRSFSLSLPNFLMFNSYFDTSGNFSRT